MELSERLSLFDLRDLEREDFYSRRAKWSLLLELCRQWTVDFFRDDPPMRVFSCWMDFRNFSSW